MLGKIKTLFLSNFPSVMIDCGTILIERGILIHIYNLYETAFLCKYCAVVPKHRQVDWGVPNVHQQ